MPQEIYLRNVEDPNYKEGIVEISNELEMLVGQIRVLFSTKPGQVLGAPDFGIDLEDYLFVTNLNEYSLRSIILDQILKFIPLSEKYHIQVSINFTRGMVRDICLIDILINGTPLFGVLIN